MFVSTKCEFAKFSSLIVVKTASQNMLKLFRLNWWWRVSVELKVVDSPHNNRLLEKEVSSTLTQTQVCLYVIMMTSRFVTAQTHFLLTLPSITVLIGKLFGFGFRSRENIAFQFNKVIQFSWVFLPGTERSREICVPA